VLYSAAAKTYSGSVSGTTSSTGYRLLYWGCKGEDVKRLQKALLSAGYKQVRSADGIYGQWTYDAVCAFQKANGLAVDGVAGKDTQNKLYGTSY
jgi:N-acetylmuramoyl-L-alanine amidase